MQRIHGTALLLAGVAAVKVQKNPIGAVIGLCNDLSAKVERDGVAEEKAYHEYEEWCDDVSSEKQHEIQTASASQEELEATISELTSAVEVCDSKIGELAESIAQNTDDLKTATGIRKEEAAVFAKNDGELADVVDTLGRAIGVLQKEMQKGSAALAQVTSGSGLANMVNALNLIIDAASFTVTDKQRLVALVQSHQESDDDDSDGEFGSPAAAAHQSQSGGILDVLEDMKEKAEEQLSELRKAETSSKQNFAMLKQSLDGQIADDNFEMAYQKNKKASSEEGTATAKGELAVTVKDLKTAKEALALTQTNCMQVAADHEASVRARLEEQKVIAQAVKILKDTVSGASFLQMAATTQQRQTKTGGFVKQLARKYHSSSLAQLASRINAVIRRGSSRGDPFVKVRGMIQDMLTKLEEQMGNEAQEKAYCDAEMGSTESKKKDLETGASKLSTKIDQAVARSSKLKEEVKDLQSELAFIAKEQKDLGKVRADEHAVYVEAKADAQKGLGGIRKALDVLRDYYGASASAALVQEGEDDESDSEQPAAPQNHGKSGGAGGSIISILEVAESDMATELTKVETEEADAQAAYDKTTQENKVTKAAKDQDVKYKSQEAAGLDKSITEWSNDRDSVNVELGAVNEYYVKLQERCVAKPESYAERKKRREAEIAGLKEALNVLENEAALSQTESQGRRGGRHMRGSLTTD